MKKLVWLIALAACQGGTSGKAPDAGVVAKPKVIDAAPKVDVPDDARVDVVAEDLGAMPAWRAVIDRDQLLKRRGQHGVVAGRVGSGTGTGTGTGTGIETSWLVDETEGSGALAIRVHYSMSPPAAGTRVAVGGAWTLDEARHWYWEADAVTPLPADAAAPAPLSATPGLSLVIAQPPPKSKVRGPDIAKEGDILQFVVVSAPRNVGDGWGVSTQKWGTMMGYLRLPGERAAFGGHDLRSADEKWNLKKQSTYWVRLGRIKRKDGEPATFEAASAPFRFY